jgi:NAD(P)-dependent dehydrogenase (short-subunit alcohol dehydrogenase family)
VVVGSEEDALAQEVEERIAGVVGVCARVEASRLEEALPAEHVVCVWGGTKEKGDAAAEALRVASEGLAVVQGLAKQERAPRLWWVTRGAVAVTTEQPVDEALGSLWGLGRTVMQEHPELGCRLVDVESGGVGVESVLRELCTGDDETEVAWRSGQRRVARLVRAPAEDRPPRELRTDGTVLITGGLGELGLHVARWFAARGMKHVLLTGRRGKETPGAPEAVAELEGMGARVTVAALDVSDGEALREVLAAIPGELPLRGLVHAARVLDDGVLTGQSAERFSRVMGPKVRGAVHLDAQTREHDLDFFVMFSSASGTFGAAGQGPYAAANVFLEALAARRRAEGLPGQSLAMGRSEAQLVLVPMRLSAVRKAFADAIPPLWRALVQPSRRLAQAKRGGWAEELRELSPAEREAAVLKTVRAEVARVLSMGSAEAVAKDRVLKELGFDSLMAVELRNALGKRVGKTLPATLVFDYPTPFAIAKYLETLISSEPGSTVQLDGAIDDLDRRLARLGRIEGARRIAVKLRELAVKWTSVLDGEGVEVVRETLSDMNHSDLLGFVERELADELG